MLLWTCFWTFCKISVHLSIIWVYSPFCCGVNVDRVSLFLANVTWRPELLRSVNLMNEGENKPVLFTIPNMAENNHFSKNVRTYLMWFWWASIVSSWQHSPILLTYLAFDYRLHSMILHCFWVFGAVALRNSLWPLIAILCSISIVSSLQILKNSKKRRIRNDLFI